MNELREQMWELCYDLLPAEQRDGLIARIKSDPQAARLYAEVRLQADLVGYAAKVEDSSLILQAEGKESKLAELAPAAGRRKEAAIAVADRPATGAAARLGGNWLVAAAALLLVGVIGYGYWRPLRATHQVARALVVTEVEVSSPMRPGLSNKIAIRNRSVHGQALSAPTDVKVFDQRGNVRFHELVQTGEDGRATIEVPGHAIVAGSRLAVQADRDLTDRDLAEQDSVEVEISQRDESHKNADDNLAWEAESINFLAMALPVASEPPLVYYLFDKPVAEPGQTLRFAALGFDRFNFEPVPPLVSDLVVKNLQGELVVQPMWRVDGNVLQGLVEMPPQQSLGTLALSSREKKSSETVRALIDVAQLEAEGARPLDRSLAQESRLELRQGGVASRKRQDALKQDAAKLLAADDKQAQQKIAGELARERPLVEKEAVAPQDEMQAELAAGRQLVEAGQSVHVDIAPELAGKKLSARAMSRGITVARVRVPDDAPASLDSEKRGKEQQIGGQFWFDLPPEVDGDIQVALIDATQLPEQVLSEQYFYRQPSKELRVAAQNPREQYAPGELVKLRLKVTSESGEASPAMLCVRVWNEAYVPASTAERAMLADVARRSPAAARLDEAQLLAVDGRAAGAFRKGTADALMMTERLDIVELKKAEGLAPSDSAAPSAPAAAPGIAPAQVAGGAGGQPEPGGLGGGGAAPDLDAFSFGGLAPSAASVAAADDVSVLLMSNEAQVKSRYRALLGLSEQKWEAWQTMIGRLLIGGGVAALAALGALFLLRIPVRAGNGTFALLAAAASLIVGAAWVNRPQGPMQIALAPHRALEPAPGPAPRGAVLPRTTAASEESSALDRVHDLAIDATPTHRYSIAPGEPGTSGVEPAPSADAAVPTPALAPAEAPLSRGDGGKAKQEKQVAGSPAASDSPSRDSTAGDSAASSSAAKPIDPGAAGNSFARGTPGKAMLKDADTANGQTKPMPAATLLAPGVDSDARGGSGRGGGILARNAAPSALYFNPQLATDADGYATLEFQLPDIDSEYRVLIDAFGQGRIGSAVLPIVCRKE